MIDTLIKEFMGIAKHLEKSEEAIIKNNYIIVEKHYIIRLLDHNGYEISNNKLAAWRDLGWIDSDVGRFTKRVRINGKTVTAIKINKKVVNTLEKWIKIG